MRTFIFCSKKVVAHKMADFEGHFDPTQSFVARNFTQASARCTRSKSNMVHLGSHGQQKVNT